MHYEFLKIKWNKRKGNLSLEKQFDSASLAICKELEIET